MKFVLIHPMLVINYFDCSIILFILLIELNRFHSLVLFYFYKDCLFDKRKTKQKLRNRSAMKNMSKKNNRQDMGQFQCIVLRKP